MQLQREDKVFSSGVHSWGVFPFVISLIKAGLGVAEPAGEVLKVGLLQEQGPGRRKCRVHTGP